MMQNVFSIQQLLECGEWITALRQWQQTLSPVALGRQFTSLLRKDLSAPGTYPLLDDIALQYQQSDEERRWRIFEQAKKLGLCTPTGALAFSQFLSSGSMSPDDQQPVYPDPELGSQVLHSALMMQAIRMGGSPVEGVRMLITSCSATEIV